MKKIQLIILMLVCSAVFAQQRLIPHLTSSTGGFTSEVILNNSNDFNGNYEFTAYDTSGNEMGTITGEVLPGITTFASVEGLFAMQGLSHFTIKSSSAVHVTVVYRKTGQDTVPAHVTETQTQTSTWRIYPANTPSAWDGIAVVNMGSSPAAVTVNQKSSDGSTISSTSPESLAAIPSMGKGLYVISSDFSTVFDSYYEIDSSQSIAIVSLRGDAGGQGLFLWDNTPIPVDDDGNVSLTGAITNVDVAGETNFTVNFTLANDGSALVGMPASAIRFTVATLVPGTNGNPNSWQSYINATQDVANPAPGWPAPVGNPGTGSSVQATYENASTGTFVDHGDGSYSYTFSVDFDAVTDPATVIYDATATHRVCMQFSDNVTNPFFDFVPSGDVVTVTRNMVKLETCNACHQKLEFHGGNRNEMTYCVTCHNPGTSDPHSQESLDMGTMVHKIHRGSNLPSVLAGGEYAIWGYRNSKHDYSHVAFPLPISNCSNCHSGASGATNQTSEGDNWKNFPTAQACGSCHDDVDFAAGTNHMAQSDNASCSTCHGASNIASTHGQ